MQQNERLAVMENRLDIHDERLKAHGDELEEQHQRPTARMGGFLMGKDKWTPSKGSLQ